MLGSKGWFLAVEAAQRSGGLGWSLLNSFKGETMNYKNSAGLFVTGVTFVIAGPLLIIIGTTFGAGALLSSSISDMAALIIGANVLGGLLSLTGIIMLIGATYRALVKIDALQVTAPSANRQHWPADRG